MIEQFGLHTWWTRGHKSSAVVRVLTCFSKQWLTQKLAYLSWGWNMNSASFYFTLSLCTQQRFRKWQLRPVMAEFSGLARFIRREPYQFWYSVSRLNFFQIKITNISNETLQKSIHRIVLWIHQCLYFSFFMLCELFVIEQEISGQTGSPKENIIRKFRGRSS